MTYNRLEFIGIGLSLRLIVNFLMPYKSKSALVDMETEMGKT